MPCVLALVGRYVVCREFFKPLSYSSTAVPTPAFPSLPTASALLTVIVCSISIQTALSSTLSQSQDTCACLSFYVLALPPCWLYFLLLILSFLFHNGSISDLPTSSAVSVFSIYTLLSCLLHLVNRHWHVNNTLSLAHPSVLQVLVAAWRTLLAPG